MPFSHRGDSMSSAWLLPEHVADVLPAQAHRIEEWRRQVLDTALGYGYELVMPPLLEHIEAILTGTGSELDLRTFKLVDQLSGRTLGVRADTTPQVARIDAHLLNRHGVTRLCYCGPVLHTRPAMPLATREPLQFGAEVYGHAGLEADLEVQDVLLDCLRRIGVGGLTLDLGDARIVRGVLAGVPATAERLAAVVAALAAKDGPALRGQAASLPAEVRSSLMALLDLYGDEQVLQQARERLPDRVLIRQALDDMASLVAQLARAHPQVRIGFDLADLSGYAYYSGTRFALYAHGATDAIARGGRYDEVGAAFGRNRPAVGFSMDLKALLPLAGERPARAAIRAPWSEDAALRRAVRQLRDEGETVVCVLPGHDDEADEYACDRELVAQDGQWVVRPV
jgi:ATP phosphoribosyltransferase regulatory subunit